MAFYIPNQPIHFSNDEHRCWEDGELHYTQISDKTDDEIDIQFGLDVCISDMQTPIIADPNFNTSSEPNAITFTFNPVGGSSYPQVGDTVYQDYLDILTNTVYSTSAKVLAVVGSDVTIDSKELTGTTGNLWWCCLNDVWVVGNSGYFTGESASPYLVNFSYTFWTTSGGINISSGLACLTGTTMPALLLKSEQVLKAGFFYKVIVKVKSISDGGKFKVHSNPSDIIFGYLESIGTYEFYGKAEANGYLEVSNLIKDANICISEIQAYIVSDKILIGIRKASDNSLIRVLNSEIDTTLFTFKKNSVSLKFKWEDVDVIDDGCYYLEYYDPCSNTNGQVYSPTILDPSFDLNDNSWAIIPSTGWSISGGKLLATYVANGKITQTNVFRTFTVTGYVSPNYSIDFSVDTISNFAVEVFFGTDKVGEINSAGVTRITGKAVGNGNLTLKSKAGSTGNIAFNYIFPVTPSSFNYVADLTSNVIKVGYYRDDKCTVVLGLDNNEDGLGFVFDGSNFTPKLRLVAKLKNAKYNGTRLDQEDSNGRKQVNYYTRRKTKLLVADMMPEYVHDFVSLLVGSDYFYINDEPYFCEEDEYNTNYLGSVDTFSDIQIEVSEQTQLIKNANYAENKIISASGGCLYFSGIDAGYTGVDYINQFIAKP